MSRSGLEGTAVSLANVLVTVALVAAGLFAYDALRAKPELPAPTVPADVSRPPAPTVAPPPPVAPSVELAGTGLQTLMHRVAELEERLGQVEAKAEQPRSTSGDAASPRSRDTWQPPAPDSGEEPRFEPEDLAWFRALKGEVDRLEREERIFTMIERQLDRAGVDLAGEARDPVVRATMKYREDIRIKLREAAEKGWTPDQRREALDEVRASYEQTVYQLAPNEAERIVEELGRYPGFASQRAFIERN